MIVYNKHEQPGCGGCLLVALFLLLLVGGIPLVFKVLGLAAADDFYVHLRGSGIERILE